MNTGSGWQALLSFAAGCVVAALLPSLPGWIGVAAVLLLGLVLLWMSPTRLIGAGLLGAAWFLSHAQWQMDRHWPDARAGEEVTVVGTVTGLPEWREHSLRFELDAASDRELPARIRVDWYRARAYLRPGERWRMTLRLRPPHGRDNPGGFDFQRYLFAARVGALGSVVDGHAERMSDDGGTVGRMRQRLAEVLQAETVDRDAAALKRALAVADRSALPDELRQLLQRTGTAHLLAISGLHVGMVAALAGLLAAVVLAPVTLVFAGLDRRRLALCFGLVGAAGYAALAGFTLPTQRALVMLAAAVAALLVRRSVAPAHALLLALIAVLAFDPLSVLSAGFWLSFSAVAVLIWAFAWRSPAQAASRWSRGPAGLIRAQLVIAAGMLPLNIGLFGQLLPGALAANLVAIPAVAVWILPMLLLEVTGILLDLPTSLAAVAGAAGLDGLVSFLGVLDGWALTHVSIAGGGLFALALAMAGAFWLLAPPGWPARWLALPMLLPLAFPRDDGFGGEGLEAWVLDVGAGQAMVIRAGGETTLYDTGPGDGRGRDVIGGLLDPVLTEIGAEELDRIVVSHANQGHSGGLDSVVDRVSPDRLYSSIAGIGRPCHKGDGWRSGAWRFRFLHPSRGLPDLGANSSCVLLVSGPGGSLLLTGGVDAAVKQRLVREYSGPPVDVMVLAAGGHRRAADREFFALADPDYALASVRRHDRWKRPHSEVIGLLADRGTRLVTTGGCGALRLRLDDNREVEVRSRVTLHPRFWKHRDGCP